jgi:hypothetical protein
VEKDKRGVSKGNRNCSEQVQLWPVPHVAAACFVGFSRKQDKKNLSEREAFGDANSAETGGGPESGIRMGAFFFANTLFVDFPLVFFLVVYLMDVCG